MNINNYLQRIGINSVENPALDFLKKLQSQHLYSIPFENLDIHHNKKISLNADDIYEKLIVQKRGGYCYELNSSFGQLLVELGFKIDLVSARVYKVETQIFTPEFDHLAIIVYFDQPYLVDVGFGDSCREPLPLGGDEIEDVSGKYKIDMQDEEYFLMKYNSDNFIPRFRFKLIPRMIEEFAEMNVYNQTSPGSSFPSRMLCSIATENGRITLVNHELIITNGTDKQTLTVNSTDEFYNLLEKYFAIKL